jgi:hypothetical protein
MIIAPIYRLLHLGRSFLEVMSGFFKVHLDQKREHLLTENSKKITQISVVLHKSSMAF